LKRAKVPTELHVYAQGRADASKFSGYGERQACVPFCPGTFFLAV
jgi:hypothetical protein